ncbi:MAG: hypothetical protein ACI92G_003571, partial [Candidatus Pelagisphaera sp.]
TEILELKRTPQVNLKDSHETSLIHPCSVRKKPVGLIGICFIARWRN